MANYLADIEAVLKGEEVEGVVIGAVGDTYSSSWSDDEDERDIPRPHRNKVLDWLTACGLLDYEYNDGYGGLDCAPVHIWTPTRVLFTCEYDGSSHISSVPRNPAAAPLPHAQ